MFFSAAFLNHVTLRFDILKYQLAIFGTTSAIQFLNLNITSQNLNYKFDL